MPFNPTTKIYTPPTGAESAAPGGLIQSAIWNTVFTDMAAALSALGQQTAVPPVMVTTATGTVSVTQPMVIYNVTTTGSLTLPVASSTPGYLLTVKTVTTSPVLSVTANVVALATTASATAIVAGTAGKWVRMVSDATNWVVMMGN
jgi:hypothetical protein